MIHCIHRCHISKQGLCSANIGSCFFAFNVLFACLQRHTQCPVSHAVYTYTDDPPRDASFEFIFCRKESCMRSPITEWHTQSLCRSNSSICSQLARRSDKRKCEQVGSHYNVSTNCVYFINKVAVVFN